MSIFIPPPNYGLVEEDLYRSGEPNELNFPFLEHLQLKKCIWLAPENLSEPFQTFLDDQNIELVHLGMSDHYQNPWNPLSEDIVVRALRLLLDPSHYPLLVCCKLGRHRTGIVVGCLRKLQRWNLTSILEEYRRYAGERVRLINEQFIELFDTDLVSAPENHPPWL